MIPIHRHRRWIGASGVILTSCVAWHCAQEQSAPLIRHITIDSATSLEVVDWGGSGVPVVMLAGLGHTAHVFDEFAVHLTDAHHVLGITRRGFGASSQPETGYDLPTLANDIRVVLDSLGIERAVLAGHSLGGDEMTQFVRAYPARVAALVYIEAAYNRVTARDSMAGYEAPSSEVPQPSETDLESVEAYRAYYARASGVRMPSSEIEAMYEWAPDGRRRGDVTPGWIYTRIMESLADPDYTGIEAPALAIYAVDYPVTELFVDYDTRDSVIQLAMRVYLGASLRVNDLSHDYFRMHMVNGSVATISGAGHSLYITHVWETLNEIRAFLTEVL